MKKFILTCLLVCPLLLTGQNLQHDLLAYFDFENDSADASGNGYRIKIRAKDAFKPGKFGQALYLNGTANSFVRVFPGIQLYSNFTIACWVKPESPTGYEAPIFYQWSPLSDRSTSISLRDGNLRYKAGDGNGKQLRYEGRQFEPDQWNLLVVKMNGCGEVTLYKGCDGSQKSFTLNIRETQILDRLYFGKDKKGNFFKGYLDEVMVWGRELSDQEIKLLCKGELPFAKHLNDVALDQAISKLINIPAAIAINKDTPPRRTDHQGEYILKSPHAKLLIWDSQTEDNDTVSVFVNGVLVLDKHRLTNRKHVVNLFLKPNAINEIICYAHNLGDYSPNTTGIKIIDGSGKTIKKNINSEMDVSGVITLLYEPDP